LFLLSKKTRADGSSSEDFSIEIPFDELKERGDDGAERLMGESVLGFFDHLTKGRLDLPKHYLDE
jgi:hypothetical protein